MNKTLFFLLIAFYCIPAPALANEDALQRKATEIYNNVMSPYCPGVTLSACTSEDARKLRDDIYSWLKDGADEDAVGRRLVNMYGSGVWGTPETSGFGALGWWMPVFVVVFGGVFVWFMIGRMLSVPVEEDTSVELDTDIDPEMLARVEAELKERSIRHER